MMSEYLMDNKELLSIFGYTDSSSITAEERTLHRFRPLYSMALILIKMQFSTPHISTLASMAYKHSSIITSKTKPGAKSTTRYAKSSLVSCPHLTLTQAHFSILKYLLQHGGGVISIAHHPTQQSLTVNVDRSKILSHGKKSLGSYLLKLHIWRCTADVSACKKLYEPMCAVDGVYEEWRKIVVSKPNMKWKFVQPNTFLTGENVEVKVYKETNEGIIQSWVERDI